MPKNKKKGGTSGFLISPSDANIKSVVSYVKVTLWLAWGTMEHLNRVPYEVMRDFLAETSIEKLLTYAEARDLCSATQPLNAQAMGLRPDKCFLVHLDFKQEAGVWRPVRRDTPTGVLIAEGESGDNPFNYRPIQKGVAYAGYAIYEEKATGEADALSVYTGNNYQDMVPANLVSLWPAASKIHHGQFAAYEVGLREGILSGKRALGFRPRAIDTAVIVPGQDPDGIVGDPGGLGPEDRREWVILRLLSVIFTGGWDLKRKEGALRADFGFTDRDKFLSEGEVIEVNSLVKDLEERNEEISKMRDKIDEKDKEIADLKEANADALADKDKEIDEKDKEIADLKEANADALAKKNVAIDQLLEENEKLRRQLKALAPA